MVSSAKRHLKGIVQLLSASEDNPVAPLSSRARWLYQVYGESGLLNLERQRLSSLQYDADTRCIESYYQKRQLGTLVSLRKIECKHAVQSLSRMWKSQYQR